MGVTNESFFREGVETGKVNSYHLHVRCVPHMESFSPFVFIRSHDPSKWPCEPWVQKIQVCFNLACPTKSCMMSERTVVASALALCPLARVMLVRHVLGQREDTAEAPDQPCLLALLH